MFTSFTYLSTDRKYRGSTVTFYFGDHDQGNTTSVSLSGLFPSVNESQCVVQSRNRSRHGVLTTTEGRRTQSVIYI